MTRTPGRHRPRTLGIAVALLAIACTSPEARFAEHVENGDALVEEGQLEKATLEYRSALKLDPEDAEVSLRLADVLLKRGDPDAEFYYGEAYRLAPERFEVGMRLARLLLIRGDTDRAAALIADALERAPDDPHVHSASSELALTRADAEGAVRAAQKAVELGPEESSAWMQLGRAYLGEIRAWMLRGKTAPHRLYIESRNAYQRADALEGGSVAAQIEMAELNGARRGTRNKQAAAAGFHAAYQLASQREDVLEGEQSNGKRLAVADAARRYALRRGDREIEKWALHQIIEIEPSRISAWKRLAELTGSDPLAHSALFLKLLESQPDGADAHLFYAGHLVEQGQERAALRHLQQQIARGLNDPLLWESVVRIQMRQGLLANARSSFVRMKDEHPEHPSTKRAEARLLLAEERFDEAARILRALTVKSENGETQRLLAFAEWRLGDLRNAAVAIDRATSLQRTFSPDTIRLAVRIHHDAGEWQRTLRALYALRSNRIRFAPRERLILARCLYETDQADHGRDELVELLQLPDAPPDAAVEYARREGANDPAQAKVHLTAALERSAMDREILEALTDLDVREGRTLEAVQRLSDLIKRRQADARVLLLRARTLEQTGALDAAEADALRAIEAEPDLPGAVDLLYSIYRAQGRLEEAQRSFEDADAAGVLHSGGRLLLSRIYLTRGEEEKALAMLLRVVDEDPDRPDAKNLLAYVLAKRGQDLDRALRLAEEAQRALSRDEGAADTVGYVYHRKGLNEAALQQLEYAIELAGESHGRVPPSFHYHRGLTLQALGRNEQAARAFEEALSNESDFPDAEDARQQLEATRARAS